jgi:four helix bundle protein
MSGTRKHGAEGLRVYWLVQEIGADVAALVRAARVRPSLADQVTRCADSLVLNIGEGASHFSPGLKLNNYRVARASAGELIAGLQRIAADYPQTKIQSLVRNTNLAQIMILKLIRSQERRRDTSPAPEAPPPTTAPASHAGSPSAKPPPKPPVV